ncbi:hypothetical protein ACOMHN_058150 [Nucella lapillus]
MKDKKKAQEMYDIASPLDPEAGDVTQLKKELDGLTVSFQRSEKAWDDNMTALCLRPKHLPVAETRPLHICRYKPAFGSSYLRYQEEILSVQPYASVFYDVIRDQEIDVIKQYITGKMVRGMVGQGISSAVVNIRTSDLVVWAGGQCGVGWGSVWCGLGVSVVWAGGQCGVVAMCVAGGQCGVGWGSVWCGLGVSVVWAGGQCGVVAMCVAGGQCGVGWGSVWCGLGGVSVVWAGGQCGVGWGSVWRGGDVCGRGWIHDKDLHTAALLSQRVKTITGLEVDQRAPHGPSSSEAMQVVNYGLGGHYDAHMDPFNNAPSGDALLSRSGARIATFLMYLTDVEKGGNTAFLRAGISVAPRKGMALFWYNFPPDMENADTLTEHAGCPVLVGQKWIANKWIWTYGNTFNRPCGPQPDSTQLHVEPLMTRPRSH